MVAEGKKMSADLNKIYDVCVANGNRLTALETTQKNNHLQNQTVMQDLKGTMEKVAKIGTQVHVQWYFLGGAYLALILGIMRVFTKKLG